MGAASGTPNAAGEIGSPRVRGAFGGRRALDHALIVLAPAATLWLLLSYHAHHDLAFDFQHSYWVAGLRVLHGATPYSWSHRQIAEGIGFPYPAVAGIFLAPFALLSRDASSAVFVALSMGAVIAALRVLSVRDWRLYSLVFLWWPVINAWQTANMTLLLVLAVALVWRYRNRPILAGVLVAVAVSIKPLVWPIGLWLLATRRYRAGAYAIGCGVAINAVGWAILGYGEVNRYLRLADQITNALYRSGYGVIALLGHVGISRPAGSVIMIALGMVLALACLWVGQHGREQAALVLAVTFMLVASPVVWNHYFALLIVPLAILRPRLRIEWAIPLALWLCPATGVTGWQAGLAALVTGSTVWLLARESKTLSDRRRAFPRPGIPDVGSVAPQG